MTNMPNSKFDARASDLLESLAESRQLKQFYSVTGPLGPTATIEGRGEVIVLCSNNYLGLANHPALKARAIEAIERLGVGSGSVRTIAGTMAIHTELERALAEFKKVEAVVVFQSGFTANAGNPGCGYDSLNVGAKSYPNAPYAGADVDADVAFISWGANGNTLGSDSGWAPNRPLGQIVLGP